MVTPAWLWSTPGTVSSLSSPPQTPPSHRHSQAQPQGQGATNRSRVSQGSPGRETTAATATTATTTTTTIKTHNNHNINNNTNNVNNNNNNNSYYYYYYYYNTTHHYHHHHHKLLGHFQAYKWPEIWYVN